MILATREKVVEKEKEEDNWDDSDHEMIVTMRERERDQLG